VGTIASKSKWQQYCASVFTMDSKQRPSIDIDQANGESTLLTISLFKLAAALANAGVRL
jgi:hypothetical protein